MSSTEPGLQADSFFININGRFGASDPCMDRKREVAPYDQAFPSRVARTARLRRRDAPLDVARSVSVDSSIANASGLRPSPSHRYTACISCSHLLYEATDDNPLIDKSPAPRYSSALRHSESTISCCRHCDEFRDLTQLTSRARRIPIVAPSGRKWGEMGEIIASRSCFAVQQKSPWTTRAGWSFPPGTASTRSSAARESWSSPSIGISASSFTPCPTGNRSNAS